MAGPSSEALVVSYTRNCAFWIAPEIPVTVKRMRLSTSAPLALSTCKKVEFPAFLSGLASFTCASAAAIKVREVAARFTVSVLLNVSVAASTAGRVLGTGGVQDCRNIDPIKNKMNKGWIAVFVFRKSGCFERLK